MTPAPPSPHWPLALGGLALSLFAVLAMSGPGRLDIVDGHTRYETARSLVDHHDCVIRDPDVWFNIFPGRDNQMYAAYRLPQIVCGVGAILLADATGPVSETRRQFLFVLTSAVA